MSLVNTKRVITDGLVALLDAGNVKSFFGEQTTNSIANGSLNTFPRVGNEWGTYNTNQYNNGSYFSIGTISGVSNNEVTTAAAHPLRTYDVVRPQTSGGGLTAGTDYYIKKTGSTTFTVHSYNGTQDGSTGFSVLQPIRNDTRISINSTSFPTMWWGYPHLGNSGLIKTIVPNAFNGHECIRLNWYRPDGVTDAMAYGPTINVKGGIPNTYSCWARAADSGAVGQYINLTTHFWAAGYGANVGNIYLYPKWQRYQFQVTPPMDSTIATYWWPSSGLMTADISEIQIESKSYATDFTPSSRGSTVATNGGWYDVSGVGNNGAFNNIPTKGNDFGGSLILNGTNQYVSITPVSSTIRTYDSTVIFAVKLPAYSGGQKCILSYRGGSGGNLYIGKSGGGIYCYYNELNNAGYTVGSITDGAPVVIAVVMNASGTTLSTYINGSLAGSATRTGWVSTYNTVLNLGYDAGGTAEYMTGSFYYYAHYNRVLSAQEINSVYTLLKPRLGL